MSTTEQFTHAQRDAIESIADQLARLAETVRSLLPERDPVEGKDYLAPAPLPPLELCPGNCPTCGLVCICDIKSADSNAYYLWPPPGVPSGALMHKNADWSELL